MQKEDSRFAESTIMEGMISFRAVIKGIESGISDRPILRVLYDKNRTKQLAGHLSYVKAMHYQYGFELCPVDGGEIDALATGTSHGNNYRIADPERACVDAAKWQLGMAKLLLENGATRAKQIIADFKPEFPSAKAYLDYMDSINTSGNRINTIDENTLAVKI